MIGQFMYIFSVITQKLKEEMVVRLTRKITTMETVNKNKLNCHLTFHRKIIHLRNICRSLEKRLEKYHWYQNIEIISPIICEDHLKYFNKMVSKLWMVMDSSNNKSWGNKILSNSTNPYLRRKAITKSSTDSDCTSDQHMLKCSMLTNKTRKHWGILKWNTIMSTAYNMNAPNFCIIKDR